MSTMLTKQPGESRIYTIIFSKNMDLGETITGITTLSAEPADLVVGSPEAPIAAGQEIQFRISGGVDKQAYKVTARVQTSLSNVLEHDVILLVRDQI